MLNYDDCGLRNIWLKNGYRYEVIKGHGKCLEIADINGLHRCIAHSAGSNNKRIILIPRGIYNQVFTIPSRMREALVFFHL